MLPGEDGRFHAPIRTAFAAFILAASSRERQSHVVGPDGDPSLPDDVCARHACRRRILLRLKTPLESAPHEQDRPNIREVQSAGIGIPITKCFCLPVLDIIRRHSRARVFALARYPRPLRRFSQSWIPGLRQEAHPGMTGENSSLYPDYVCLRLRYVTQANAP